MPSKKTKYNARFPAARIKKIMQSDDEIGKVAQAVPVIISRTLELFIESILTKTLKITLSRNAKTLSPSHMKQCIMTVPHFDFLRELVKNVPDINMIDDSSKDGCDNQSSDEQQRSRSNSPRMLSIATTSKRSQQSNGSGEVGYDFPQDLRVRPQDLRVIPQDLSLPSTSANCRPWKMPNGSGAGNVLNTTTKIPDKKCALSIDKVSSTTNLLNAGITTGGNNRCNTNNLANTKMLLSESSASLQSRQQRTSSNASHLNLYHQSQSVTTSTSTYNRSLSVSAMSTMPKKSLSFDKEYTPQSTAISAPTPALPTPALPTPALPTPAPILGIDFCNKPVIKIDYSNLQALQITSTVDDDQKVVKSVTVPANANHPYMSNITPVISIDLSNIVTNVEEAPVVTAASTTTKPNQSIINKIDATKQNQKNSTSTIVATAIVTATATTTATTTVAATATTASHTIPNLMPTTANKFLDSAFLYISRNNRHLDLDEDYDNL